MTAIKGVNSYVDVAEAEEYFAGRLYSESWDTSLEKDSALISATIAVDAEMRWFGHKTDEDQPLGQPRDGHIDIPDDISKATMEVALEMLSQQLMTFTEESVELKVLKSSSESMEFYETPGAVLSVFNSVAKGLLLRYGSSNFGSRTAISNVGVVR